MIKLFHGKEIKKVISVNFYDTVEDQLLKFVVIVVKYQGKWVLCKHKERSTYEFPGGHREQGESVDAAARRELWEETGAEEYAIEPVCVYSVSSFEEGKKPEEESFGMLYTGEIFRLGNLPPEFEMEKTELFDEMPDSWTYPKIQPRLLEKIQSLEK